MTDPDVFARQLAAESSHDDPTAWFERLYAAAADGRAQVPWDRGAAHPLLVEWTEREQVHGPGSAMVVGAGPGFDAEYVSARGFDTTAFDVSPTAVELTRRRNPASSVGYKVADLLALPSAWRGAFDLVIETFTVQSLPVRMHEDAIGAVAALVAPGGTLVVIAAGRDESDRADGPPWPLTRAEIERFASDSLVVNEIGLRPMPTSPDVGRWLATFTRPRG